MPLFSRIAIPIALIALGCQDFSENFTDSEANGAPRCQVSARFASHPDKKPPTTLCPNQPSYNALLAGTGLSDNFQNAGSDLDRCLARAGDHGRWCGAPSNVIFEARFFDQSGYRDSSKFSAEGCLITAESTTGDPVCPGQPGFEPLFAGLGYWDASASWGGTRDGCHARAEAFTHWCAAPVGAIFTADHHPQGDPRGRGMDFAKRGCVVTTHQCDKFPTRRGAGFVDPDAAAQTDETRCAAQRSLDYDRWCENVPGETPGPRVTTRFFRGVGKRHTPDAAYGVVSTPGCIVSADCLNDRGGFTWGGEKPIAADDEAECLNIATERSRVRAELCEPRAIERAYLRHHPAQRISNEKHPPASLCEEDFGCGVFPHDGCVLLYGLRDIDGDSSLPGVEWHDRSGLFAFVEPGGSASPSECAASARRHENENGAPFSWLFFENSEIVANGATDD